MSLQEPLRGVSEQEYGDVYKEHFLSIYNQYIDMADRISSRRQSANSFFLTINTAIVSFISSVRFIISTPKQSTIYLPIAIAGIILCYSWYRLLVSYKELNSAKFSLICQMEKELPLKPYDTEWQKLREGKKSKRHMPFSKIETIVPWVFLLLHVFFFIYSFAG
jgi:hypothetical protein